MAAVHGYHVAFWTAAALLVAGALLSGALIDVTRHHLATAHRID